MTPNSRTLIAAIALATVSAGAAQAQTSIGGGKAAISFPIVINEPGSYKLAANLLVPAGLVGIHVQSSGVTLDLNGYTIAGSSGCTGAWPNVTCASNNNHKGVLGGPGVTVRNGRVTNFTYAIQLGDGSVAEDLTLDTNAWYGLAMGHQGTARHVTTRSNGLYGVWIKNGMASHLHVSQSHRGVFMQGGMLQSSVVRETTYAYDGNGFPSGVRDTFLQGQVVPYAGISMGGNLCNLQPC
jgi:hypothetical protein